ncbi:MAG: FKBP-type peptidyl-prolyl cis-trans isomerase [Candidatus Paceibacterota bacterium]
MENKKNMSLIVSGLICLAVVAVLVFISMNKSTDTNMDSNNNGVTATDNGSGASDVAKAGDTVSMNYTGRLQDGTVFDSNVDPKFNHAEPLVFKLGTGQVIPGWDKGIVGMKVGEKKTLTIAPEDAYGASGIPGAIPPNSTLVFDVELVSINK